MKVARECLKVSWQIENVEAWTEVCKAILPGVMLKVQRVRFA